MSESNIKPYKMTDEQKHLLDQYADDLTMYLERNESNRQNYSNINSALYTLEQFLILFGLKVNRGKTMLTIFICNETIPTM